ARRNGKMHRPPARGRPGGSAESRLQDQLESQCDSCGQRPAVVPIESGQLLCVECVEGLRTAGPAKLASAPQRRLARALGFEGVAEMSDAQVDELLTLHRHVRQYVFDVWKESTGESPKKSGVSAMETMHFVTWLITTHAKLASGIVRMERVRDRQAALERDRLRQRLGPDTPITLAELRPRPLRDRTFELIAARLREKWGSDTCKLGIPSSLIVGREKASTRPRNRA